MEQVEILNHNIEEYKPLVEEYEQELRDGNKRF